MRVLCRSGGLGLLMLGLLPVTAFGQNTSPSSAAVLLVGQRPVVTWVDDYTTERWYQVLIHGGQSYCVEATTGQREYLQGRPVVTVTDSVGNHMYDSVAVGASEPEGYEQARVCFQAPAGPGLKVKLTDQSSGMRQYNLRMLETTLWSPWFYINGDYNSFLLLRNTTNLAVGVSVIWRDATGQFAMGAYTGSIPGRGAVILNARDYVTGIGNYSGTVEVAHTGSLEAIVGQVTSLSGTTGLNFDSQLQQRKPW
jgi:hypothetical protein